MTPSRCSCLSSWPQSFFLARNRSRSAQELSCQDSFFKQPCPAPALYCHTENSSAPGSLPPVLAELGEAAPGYRAISKRKVTLWNEAALSGEAEMV